MINNLRTLFSAGLCASALLFSGCTSDDTSTGTDSSTTNSTATATGTGTGTDTGTDTGTGTGTDTGTGTSMGETSTTTGGNGGGFCQLGCSEDADCCPMGAMDCPGEYPYNLTCNGGVCESGGCSNDEQCTFDGLLPDWKCLEAEGYNLCSLPCEADADCEAVSLKCVGLADDGTKYCGADAAPPCTKDEECGGFGVCTVETGACGCSSDDECTAEGTYVCK